MRGGFIPRESEIEVSDKSLRITRVANKVYLRKKKLDKINFPFYASYFKEIPWYKLLLHPWHW